MLFWSHPAMREHPETNSQPGCRILLYPIFAARCGKCRDVSEESDCRAQLARVPASSEFIENVK